MVNHAPLAVFEDEDVGRCEMSWLVAACLEAGDECGVSEHVRAGRSARELPFRGRAEDLFPATENRGATDDRRKSGVHAHGGRLRGPKAAHRVEITVAEGEIKIAIGRENGGFGRDPFAELVHRQSIVPGRRAVNCSGKAQ